MVAAGKLDPDLKDGLSDGLSYLDHDRKDLWKERLTLLTTEGRLLAHASVDQAAKSEYT